MPTRSYTKIVTFGGPVILPGCSNPLPAGDYEVLVEEELLEGLSFLAWHRTGTFLTAQGKGGHVGRRELYAISDTDLKEALLRDESAKWISDYSEAALSPQADKT
jgi:hypothetical protein